MARPKMYHVSLTDDDLKALKSVIRKKQTSKTIRSRCKGKADIALSHNHINHTVILIQRCRNGKKTVSAPLFSN